MQLPFGTSVLGLLLLLLESAQKAQASTSGAALTPREMNGVGDPDPACYKKNDCEKKALKTFESCETSMKEVEGLELFHCMCRMGDYHKLMKACSECYPDPEKAFDQWRGTCREYNISVDYVLTMGPKDEDNSRAGRVDGGGIFGVGAVAAAIMVGLMV